MNLDQSLFVALTGHALPFRWQESLYAEFTAGRCPAQIDLPTGMGKTTVMGVWLLALAAQARRGLEFLTLPRRLVWVVDRRVVVDQATEEAKLIREKVLTSPDLLEVRRALSELSGDDEGPLVISTLRGELADNRHWSGDPSRPAIIVGTVDMIGSRLLFSGYGVSHRMRPRQAGLLAYDTLLVNDEAHLTPVFAKLVDEVQALVRVDSPGRPPLQIVRLSATQRDDGPTFPENLTKDEAVSEVFRMRYNAPKKLELITDDLEAIEKLAVEPAGRTIIFVRSPERARKIAAAIRKEHNLDDGEVPLITGEQRGRERDELVDTEPFKRFTADAERKGDCWLVATSAGEVGVNISCDRLITELDTADHLLQRFGRLNRFGETEGVAIVVATKNASDAEKATLRYLESLDGSVSPKALRDSPPGSECLSPEPKRAPLQPWLIDVWSMTSLSEKDWATRPEVGPWLRGDDEDGPPETYVCWRHDVPDLVFETVSDRDREEVFHWFPVLAHERLKQRTDRLCEDLEKSPHGDLWVLLIGRDRTITPLTISSLTPRAERSRLHYATLVLPPGLGRLDSTGAVDWSKSVVADEGNWKNFDVSEIRNGDRRRIKARPGAPDPDEEGLVRRHRVLLVSEDETGEAPSWRYYTASRIREKGCVQSLEEHQLLVRERAATLGERLLGSQSRFVDILRWVAERHDLGKACPLWQRYARNEEGNEPWAKSERFANPSVLAGYRHEMGSLLAREVTERGQLSAEEHDLALHLIASHHGLARPHFPDRAFDKRSVRASRRTALETAQRFARLQRGYGHIFPRSIDRGPIEARRSRSLRPARGHFRPRSYLKGGTIH